MSFHYRDSTNHDTASVQNWQSIGVTTPPKAPQRPYEITRHGDTRVDPYYWMMDRESSEVRELLEAENAFTANSLQHLKPLEEILFNEFKGRIVETDTSVPVRRKGWWYFERTREGLNYPVSCRVPVSGDDPTPPVIDPHSTLPGEQVIFDENAEAEGHDFLSVGVLAVSPDDSLIAAGTDFTGSERHTVTFRPLEADSAPSDVLTDVYYGFTWASNSRHVFYTKVDDSMRPWQLWRHEVGTSQDKDVLVHQEGDPQYFLSVSRTRDEAFILVSFHSSMTTEVRYVAADDPTANLQILQPRVHGIEYGVDHLCAPNGEGWWLMVTNENATDFKLLARRESDSEWRTLIGERPGNRLDGVDTYARYIVTAERVNGCAAVRIAPLLDGEDPFGDDFLERSYVLESGVYPHTVVAADTPTYDTEHLRVIETSLVTPRRVIDVVMATGEFLVRKQETVKGFEPADYVTGRIWVSASDGVAIPVSVVARRDVVNEKADGTLEPRHAAPFLLYGYGSYEISIDPSFSPFRLSLLDRGVIFAIAHVRGGGEMGRRWYEMGKMAQKPTSFSDYVTCARWFIANGWTSSDKLAARGGSAGGLLMGASMNLDPSLFKAVVAEVPFVDVVTTMLDDSLPLTTNEWEEWGNPDADPHAYRTMKSYSPYDNISTDRYPVIYATGGLNDSRVGFWEPTKWVHALRDANPDNVVYLKMEMGAGHGGPSGRYDSWRDEAGTLAFIVDQIAN